MELDCTTVGSERINIADSIGHYDDSNTAIIFPSGDRISIYAGGVGFLDMHETTQDVMYIGNGPLGTGADIDIYIGTNNAIFIEGSSGNITIQDQMNLDKTGTADAGTQYPSQDLILTGSVWDTTNTQAEDRTITISNICGSGVNGSEPYRLAIEDNSGNEFVSFHGQTQTVGIGTGATSAGVQLEIKSTGVQQARIWSTDNDLAKFWLRSGNATGSLYVDNNTNKLTIDGGGYVVEIDGANSRVSYNGASDSIIYNKMYSRNVNDDASITLPSFTNGCWGFCMIGNNEEYAFFVVDDDGDVTLINNSANVVANADTDANLCIGTSATEEPLVVKNRLGGAKTIFMLIWHN
jgi:hypothetical protein